MKKDKLKITIFTLLVVFTFALFTYPTTNSKYKSWDDVKTYQASFYNLYKGKKEMQILPKSDIIILPINDNDTKNINLKLEFERNLDIKDTIIKGEVDDYYFELPSACTLVSTDPSIPIVDKTVKFREKDINTNITLNCKITKDNASSYIKKVDNKDYLDINIPIYEKIGENKAFIYLDAYVYMPLEEYNKEISPIKASITLDTKDIPNTYSWYEYFKAWVRAYKEIACNDNTHKEIIENYVINKNINNEEKFNEILNKLALNEKTDLVKGLNVQKIGNNRYLFTIEDNLEGYSLHNEYLSPYAMYFTLDTDLTNKTPDEINKLKLEVEEIFNYYLNYTINGTRIISEENANIIANYLKQKGGIAEVILNNQKVLGLNFNKDKHLLTLYRNLTEIATSLDTINPHSIKWSSRTDMFNIAYASIEDKYLSIIEANRTFQNRLNNSIAKNNTDTTPAAGEFTDYFALKMENNKYMLIKVYSDAKNKANIIKIDELVTPDNMSIDIKYNMTTTYMDITISSTSENKINDIEGMVGTLNGYFKTNHVFNSANITGDSYTYRLDKNAPIEISYNDPDILNTTLNNLKIKEPNVYNDIYNDVKNIITRQDEFINYYTYYNNNSKEYILVKVYSDISNNKNIIKIEELVVPNGINISLNNIDTSLDITLSSKITTNYEDLKTNMNSILNTLNRYFGLSETEIVLEEENASTEYIYTYNYKIEK